MDEVRHFAKFYELGSDKAAIYPLQANILLVARNTVCPRPTKLG